MIFLPLIAKLALLSLALDTAPNLPGWSPPLGDYGNSNWICPADPLLSIELGESQTSNGPLYTLQEVDHGRVRNIANIDSALMADYLGFGNLGQRDYKWVGKRLFLSICNSGIGMLDLDRARFVYNNTCVDFVPLTRDRFLVLATRCIPRHGPFDYQACRDSVYLVDPAHLHLDDPSLNPTHHVARALKLSGMIASRFIKLSKPDQVGAFFVHDGKLQFIELNTMTLKIVATKPVVNPVPDATMAFVEEGQLDKSLPNTFPDAVHN
jgi:hypothetical protein